jgi:small subunit ribosomal protein S14|tara:strand:- start:1886 stop:2191 length:306 start_codon:yes stop_codon:yes gene_type:complete
MAKLSAINKNNRRIRLSNKFFKKRKALKKIIMDRKLPLEERFKAQQKLSKLPRNSSKIRVMNRCQITGRPHGVYRKLKISRIALRQLGLEGKIPGLVKSSW